MRLPIDIKQEVEEEINAYIEDANDIFAFEKYCGACMHFDNPDECPLYNKVDNMTEWKKINCDKFFD